MKKYTKILLILFIIFLQTSCSKDKKVNDFNWEQMIRNDFYSNESIIEQMMEDVVSLKIKSRDNQLVISIKSPNICEELLEWIDSVEANKFSEVAMEKEILRLLEETPTTEKEYLLDYYLSGDVPRIVYTTEFGEAMTCGMTRVYLEVTQQILEEIEEDAL